MKRQRLAIISHALRAGGGVSVGANIIRSVHALRPEDSILVTIPAGLPEFIDATRSGARSNIIEYQDASTFGRIRFDHRILPRALADFSPDVVLSLGNVPVRVASAFQAVLVQNAHLVNYDRHRPIFPLAKLAVDTYQKSLIRHSLPTVGLVFTQTESMRQRFIQTYNYRGPIEVLPNALSASIAACAPQSRPPELPSGRFYLLCLSRYYPHKNLESIVDCFAQYRDALRSVTVLLTISENDHPKARHLIHRIRTLRLDDQVVNLGPIPQPLLSRYYRHVQGLLLPTLLESFSGSYIEAMQFHCPILTSDRDFAREVCDRAAVYFDPLSAKSMCNAIVQLQSSNSLAYHLVQEGQNRCRTLSKTWEEIVAKALLDIDRHRAPVSMPSVERQ